jgi:hypothetical protein
VTDWTNVSRLCAAVLVLCGLIGGWQAWNSAADRRLVTGLRVATWPLYCFVAAWLGLDTPHVALGGVGIVAVLTATAPHQVWFNHVLGHDGYAVVAKELVRAGGAAGYLASYAATLALRSCVAAVMLFVVSKDHPLAYLAWGVLVGHAALLLQNARFAYVQQREGVPPRNGRE